MVSSSPVSLAKNTGGVEVLVIRLLQGLFAALCVFYAVLAFDYFISFAAGRDGLWMRVFSIFVSEDYAHGPGSVHVDQNLAYSNGLRFMLMHTTMGAICMAIGPFQFIAAFRQRYRALHRNMGKVYLLAVGLSMFAGLAYLSITPFDKVYSGAPFAIGLVGLHLLVLYTGYKAYRTIRQRKITKHQQWMAMNYGLLLSTPVLRLLWIAFGIGFPHMNQAEANLAITTFLIPVSVMVGIVWLAAQRPRGAH